MNSPVNLADLARYNSMVRPLGVMARTFVEPMKPIFAWLCTGSGEETKVVASGYGTTEEEALAAVKADGIARVTAKAARSAKAAARKPRVRAAAGSTVKAGPLMADLTLIVRERNTTDAGRKFVARAMRGNQIVTYAYGANAQMAEARLRLKL